MELNILYTNKIKFILKFNSNIHKNIVVIQHKLKMKRKYIRGSYSKIAKS
jgi:hypothetical protein